MRRFVFALVLLFVLLATAAQAAVGKPFLKGVGTPAELAEKIEGSLAKDPSGRTMLDPERCKRDGSCARPMDYLVMFALADPAAHLTGVGEVPGFLRSLVVTPAPAGEYWISCLKPLKGGGHEPKLHCLSRRFKPGETAWTNLATGRVVLASDCTNPIEKPVVEKCVEIHFSTRPGDEIVRFALLGPSSVSDECIGVKRAGEAEWETWWQDECADLWCTFAAAASVIGQPTQIVGSYRPEPGDHILRLPAFVAEQAGELFHVVLCLQREAQMSSDTIGVQYFNYVYRTPKEEKKAIVWYSREEVPYNAPPLYWPWGEWGR